MTPRNPISATHLSVVPPVVRRRPGTDRPVRPAKVWPGVRQRTAWEAGRDVTRAWLDLEEGRRGVPQIVDMVVLELRYPLRALPVSMLGHPDQHPCQPSRVVRTRVVGRHPDRIDVVSVVARARRDGVIAFALRPSDWLVTELVVPNHLDLRPPPPERQMISWAHRGTS